MGACVALRKESVDRNHLTSLHSPRIYVALRKESVDRNTARGIGGQHVIGSLSARRAWIEMQNQFLRFGPGDVALRKESVDRNAADEGTHGQLAPSLSARRAWIEMPGPALWRSGPAGRSPQGERG